MVDGSAWNPFEFLRTFMDGEDSLSPPPPGPPPPPPLREAAAPQPVERRCCAPLTWWEAPGYGTIVDLCPDLAPCQEHPEPARAITARSA